MVEPFVAVPFVPINNVDSHRNHVFVIHFERVFHTHAEFSFGFKRNSNC